MLPFSLNKSAVYTSCFNSEKISDLMQDLEVEADGYQSDFAEENADYVPPNMDHTYYTYPGISSLNPRLEDIDKSANVVICEYMVNTTGNVPFLQFILANFRGQLQFLRMASPLFSIDNVKGFCVQDDITYLFCECESTDSEYKHKYAIHWPVLVDEIMNHKKVCDIPIHDEVITFFNRNPHLLFLENKKGQVWETPVVGYYGTNKKDLDYVTLISVPCERKDALMGPHHYYTTYEGAIKQGKDSITDKHKYCGITRHALILGKTMIPMNMPNDPIDESQMKQQLLKEDRTNKTRLTMRISDHDSNWTKYYDSVYIGKVELDDGSILVEFPQWIVHRFDDKVMLSWHMIDSKLSNNIQ